MDVDWAFEVSVCPGNPSHGLPWRCASSASPRHKEFALLGTILLIVLVLVLIGVIPTWPHSRGWGYGPSGGLGLVLLILIVLWLMGKI